jgi:hypothetical protein
VIPCSDGGTSVQRKQNDSHHSAAAENTAVALARKVEGVKSVKNDMRSK